MSLTGLDWTRLDSVGVYAPSDSSLVGWLVGCLVWLIVGGKVWSAIMKGCSNNYSIFLGPVDT